jgi:hypothetical protein
MFGRKKIDEHQMNAKQHIILHTSRRIGENMNVLRIPNAVSYSRLLPIQ